MKELVRGILRKFGFDIIRYGRQTKSVRTSRLSYYATSTGQYYLPTDAHEDEIADAIKNNRIFDQKVYETAKKYIRTGTTVLDIGANFGQMTVLFSQLVGTNGIVHSFEADEFVYEVLKKNASINSLNVVTHCRAVHDKSNETLYFPVQDFTEFGTYGSYGIDYVHGTGRPVATLAIDDIPFKLPVSFMKVDVEGGELFVLKGAVNTINKYRMPIIFEYGSTYEEKLGLSFQDCVTFIKSIDYRFERVIDNINYLVVPNEEAVRHG